MLSGEIARCSRTYHLVHISGETLAFWSAYPFYAGWLKEGDQVQVVYQRIPFILGVRRIALAFRVAGSAVSRGVAAREQLGGLILASVCSWVFGWLIAPPKPALAALCSILASISLVYLALMLQAQHALRRFVAK